MRVLLVAFAILLAGCTGSQGPDLDTDDDLAEDTVETEGLVIVIELLGGAERRHVTSDPAIGDTDGDGLLDGEELLIRGTDPRDVDTDDDGLLDGDDIPTERAPAAEWRQLGILEIEGLFLGELDACPGQEQVLRANQSSSDLPMRDELTDGEEVRGWDVQLRGERRHVASDPCKPDSDDDGLLDHDEKTMATDPRQADTDHDGVNDGVDGDPLWDLGLELHDVEITGSNATSARIVLVVGDKSAEIRWPGNASAHISVSDATGDREHLPLSGIIHAERDDGSQLALFPDPRGAILSFDLLEGTASGATLEGDTLRFEGADGTLTLRWSVARR